MKKILVVLAVVFAILIVAVIALPLIIDVNRFKPTLETTLTTALGRKVEIGSIELALLSGGVKVDNVSIADDPAFSHSPFLQARELTAGVALMPLIFSKELQVSSFTVTDPQVSLLRSPSGAWNYSTMAANGSKSKSDGSTPANFSVGKLKISNGTISVGNTGAGGKTQTYQGVDFEASDLSYTSQFPFSLTAKTPGSGSVKVEGKAGPVDANDASLTPLEAKIDVVHLDVASTGFVDAASGVAGLIDFTGNLTSDGHQMTSKGSVKADKIKFAPAGSPASVPVNVDYDTAYDLKGQMGSLKQGDVHIGKALAKLTGTYNTAGAAVAVQMKLTGQGMPVADLEGVLPAAGVTLPSGASLKEGSLNLDLAIAGPVDKLVITGPVNMSNAKLTGFDLKSKLGALSSFTGLGGSGGSDTVIQTLSANLRVDPSGTQANNLDVVVPSLATVTGNGSVSASGQLNCKMAAKLAPSSNPIGSVASALTAFGGKGSQGGGGIPFTITGTTSNPVFRPDLGGLAGGAVKGIAATPKDVEGAATSVLGGLFGKKKN